MMGGGGGPQRPSKPGVWSGWANRRWEDSFNSLLHSQINPPVGSVHLIHAQAALSERDLSKVTSRIHLDWFGLKRGRCFSLKPFFKNKFELISQPPLHFKRDIKTIWGEFNKISSEERVTVSRLNSNLRFETRWVQFFTNIEGKTIKIFNIQTYFKIALV